MQLHYFNTTKKHASIVSRRSAQITTTNRNVGSPQGSAKLSSLRTMYGINRISAYMEVEYEKGRLNNHSSKRSVIHCLVSIPCAGNFTLRKEYQGRVGLLTKSGNFQKSPIPNSGTPQNLLTQYLITPQDSRMITKTNQTPNPCLKG